MEATIAAERVAIREADAARVLQLAEDKERLVAQLAQSGLSADEAPQLQGVVEQLRENLLLLVYARGCVKDRLEACLPSANTYQPRGASPTRLATRLNALV